MPTFAVGKSLQLSIISLPFLPAGEMQQRTRSPSVKMLSLYRLVGGSYPTLTGHLTGHTQRFSFSIVLEPAVKDSDRWRLAVTGL